MPYPNEHACRLREPNGRPAKRVNGDREHNGKAYDVIYQQKRDSDAWEEQAYRYPKEKWTADSARAHCRSHDGLSFEAASGKSGECVTCAKAAIPPHETATTDGEWDTAARSRLPNERNALRQAHAWVDGALDADLKTSYKFFHHEVAANGTVGAANTRVATSGIGVLNGGRGGTNIPDADKPGVWRHLAKHLKDAGIDEVPALKDVAPLTRAYALLHAKAVDEEKRILTGMATTPTPDRIGDIIEPLGVSYKNPLPLLLYHDAKAPVGTVTLARPTKQGVAFTAHIAKIAEPGRLKDRVDEAWHTVKAGLVRAVSIGFRVVNDAVEEIDTGFRFLETEILEVSLVTVPANQDATIETVRSIDVRGSAATGTPARVASTLSGAADITHTRTTTMNASEKVTQAKADLKAKTARLEDIAKSGEDAALSDEVRDESRTLAGEVKALTDDIDRWEAIERAQAALAKPAAITSAGGGPMPVKHVTVEPVKLPPGMEFARYVITLMAARGNPVLALEIAKARYPDNPQIQMVHRAAVAGATTTDSAWLGALVTPTTLAAEFIEFLRPQTIIGKFGTGTIPSLRRVPFNVRILGQTSGATGAWVGQTVQKPLRKFGVAVAHTLNWAKVSAIMVFAEELARFSSPSAEMLIRDELVKALVERLDTDFVDPAKAIEANVSPASITNGLVALTPSGTDAAAVRADLAQLFQTFIDANNTPTQGVFITSNTVALALSLMMNALGQPEFPGITMTGGTLVGLPVIASQFAAVGSPVSNLLILANASDIFLSDDGGVAIDMSREATLEMSDDPANEVGTNVNMFQTNQIALRAERFINWAKRRTSAVAYLEDVAYAAGSPA